VYITSASSSPLHVLDVLANADLRPGLGFDVGRARQVVGMGVGLKRPHDGMEPLLLGRAQHGFD
jgi:hypothetical protein